MLHDEDPQVDRSNCSRARKGRLERRRGGRLAYNADMAQDPRSPEGAPSPDFDREFGLNAGYVQEFYEAWRADPASVTDSWGATFRRLGLEPAPRSEPPASAPATPHPEEDADYERLTGIAGRIAVNMEASLEVPTASSARTIPAKLLAENRQVLNEHMRLRALGKASFTHLVAFAIVRALREMPRMQSAHVDREGKRHRRLPRDVNLGLAIDVEGREGRNLVVPKIAGAQDMDFLEFYEAYEDVVRRARAGELGAADFQGVTTTLTNPGGFGTSTSQPRLMPGQGLIVATGSIGVPAEASGLSPAKLAELGLGPVLTVTSTYDHRVIQGAESGLFLRRVEALLSGEDALYEEIFRAVRCPWSPFRAGDDERGPGEEQAQVQARVWQLINAYRVRGNRLADLDPLVYDPAPQPSLDPATYGFTVWDLDRSFYSADLFEEPRGTLREILAALRRAYCRRWTVEYMHIASRERKLWVRRRVEDPAAEFEFDVEHRRRVLELLSKAENFERFLHSQYVGNKRFSLEGADALIPALAELLDRAASRGVEKVVLGMAHRGRLNVLANILGKSYEQVFTEFEGVLLPIETEGSGDVKYHVGQRGTYTTRSGQTVELELCANPSHLEAVDPVVCGMTRACQDERGDQERRDVLAVLIHGDAAFCGQGVVTETLNMSELRAYRVGGTIHLVVNNQIGFTAGPRDLRSTYYCTDVAKGIEAPILHANGDYPESVLRSVQLALDYQREFRGDAVVDIVCYRRWGHNEGDEPAFTQPVLYSQIHAHPSVREHYTRLLIRRGTITRAEADEIGAAFDAELREAVARSKAREEPELSIDEVVDLDLDEPEDYVQDPSPETGVEAERLVEIVERTNRMPAGYVTHPNLLRQLKRREEMVGGGRDLDWGCAEILAYGSLLLEGRPIRLAGQDSARGTFSHRHSVIRDQLTGAEHVPLATLSERASFEAWDSLLSEEAALAFEYGYAHARRGGLVIWEAQFGDFVNGAQIPIDQFVVAGRAKWRQRSGLTLLLPHGYDGQGPEHSSARPERFLAACTGGNLAVCNATTPAQFFHLLRRQARAELERPLVVLTPKSLLRDPRAGSPIGDLVRGSFQELLPDPSVDPESARRLVLCSGKVYYDLDDHRRERGIEDVAICRLEQLYPLPRAALQGLLERFGAGELVWCQEEPRNMGAWVHVRHRLAALGHAPHYVGRADSPSPATGSYRRHLAEQEYVVRMAFEPLS